MLYSTPTLSPNIQINTTPLLAPAVFPIFGPSSGPLPSPSISLSPSSGS